MTLRREMLVIAWALMMTAALCLCAAGCSKTNTVERNVGGEPEAQPEGGEVGQLGDQCESGQETGCGVASRCVLGFCRTGCTNDAECPRGSICIGTEPPFGCALDFELDCESAADCDLGLTCGLDKKCRHPCGEDDDCPRNEHVCIADACVSKNEGDFDKWSFPCTRGTICCVEDADNVVATDEDGDGNCIDPPSTTFTGTDDANKVVVCNVTGPGWQVVDTCRNFDACAGAHRIFCNEHFPSPRGGCICEECVVTDETILPVCQ